MPLGPKISEELKIAMKNKDVLVRDTLRMVKSELGQAEIQKGGTLDDAEEMAVLLRAVKTRTGIRAAVRRRGPRGARRKKNGPRSP